MEITISNQFSIEIEEAVIIDGGSIELIIKPSTEGKAMRVILGSFISKFSIDQFCTITNAPFTLSLSIISSTEPMITDDTSAEVDFNSLPIKLKNLLIRFNELIAPTQVH